jgi:hypothetical protein
VLLTPPPPAGALAKPAAVGAIPDALAGTESVGDIK